jgi:hypothetical protein
MGLAPSNLNWNHLIDYLFALRQGDLSAVLFRQSALPDPCVLVGAPLVNIATEYAKKSGIGLYATGYGQCTHCSKPTIYTWFKNQSDTSGSWSTNKLTDEKILSEQLFSFADQHNLEYVYLVKTDDDHKIREVVSVYHREQKKLHPLPGCQPNKPNSFQVLNKNANIIVIVIIIILIVFLLWIVFSGCRPTETKLEKQMTIKKI